MSLEDLFTLARTGHVNFFTHVGRKPDGDMQGVLSTYYCTAITDEMDVAIKEALSVHAPTILGLAHYSDARLCMDPGNHQASYYSRGNDFTYCADCAAIREDLTKSNPILEGESIGSR